MSLKQRLALGAAVGLTLASVSYANAATGVTKDQIDALQQQIQLMQQQLQALQQQVQASDAAAKQAQANATAAVAAAKAATPAPAAPGPKIIAVTDPNKPFHVGLSSADGQNTVELTGRYQFDAGTYFRYRPNDKIAIGSNNPLDLSNGVNARRARIGVTGKFGGDWNYTLIYDFGGSTDVVGANPSGIENGFIEYAGIKGLYLDLGYLDVPYTLEESQGSNDILFMERASSQQFAVNIAAGDFRSVAGFHFNRNQLYVGAFATGPVSGAQHTFTPAQQDLTTSDTGTASCPAPGAKPAATKCPVAATGTTSNLPTTVYTTQETQLGAVARIAYRPIVTSDYSLHVGGDFEDLIAPPRTISSAGVSTHTLTLSDRPELRIDPTALTTTGAISNVKSAQVYSGELAGQIGPFFGAGEFFHYHITRDDGSRDFAFDGGYFDVSYALTGEQHPYNETVAAYQMLRPAHPFQWNDGTPSGYGAWEIAARYSEIDANDFVSGEPTANNVTGGLQRVYTGGLNWYVNSNIKFMLNYLHGSVDKSGGSAKFDAVGLRSQFVW